MNVTYQLNQYHRDNMNLTDQLNQYHRDNMNLTDQLNQYHRDNMNLTDQLNQYHRHNMNLTDHVQRLETRLNQYHVSQAVEWSPSPTDGAVIGACVGQDVTLDWNYTLAQGETVEDIKCLETQLNQYHKDNMNLPDQPSQYQQPVIGIKNLTDYVQRLETRLNQYHDSATRRVSFQARFKAGTVVDVGQHVILDDVIGNDGVILYKVPFTPTLFLFEYHYYYYYYYYYY
nr:hypothetical protein BaRGS_021146 [Batillaria attramentaria]